ncbi:MAG: PIN domain-containing protein [Candidatus Delongbacteria bacterium]|nr:PIN domain-containing protein [Candidatus Delongbacteria bacterium]
MKYMLDTNICIYIIKKKPISVIEKLKKMKIDDIAISIITLSELAYGVEKSSAPAKNRIALTEFLSPINIMEYNDNAALFYGRIRADLERKGSIIGPMDLLIASHALALDLTLITNNEKEFKRVNGLRVKNWI